jgi:hypothetical protein
MKTIFVKILEDGRVIEAPKNYKNISNFNKFPSLMKKEGFEEKIKAWKKSDGTMEYITPESLEELKETHTDFPYLGKNYEWSDETGGWQIKLEVAKESKLKEIRNATNNYMKQLKQGFSDAEMETWGRQENGLKFLTADMNSEEYDAQWVKALAATRGISLEEQLQRISYASNLMNTYAYQLVGYQQHLEDLVNAATSIDELNNIRFDITGTIKA